MTILAVIQDVCRRQGLTVPSAAAASTEKTVRQLFGLANQSALAIARRGTWQALTREKTFSTVAAMVQTNSVPSDFDWIIPDTAFNRSRSRPLVGPLSNQEWQRMQATLSPLVENPFRFRGGSIEIHPAPTAGETCAYEYMSKMVVRRTADDIVTELSVFEQDGDEFVLDEELLKLDLMWRFKDAKGLNYAEDFNAAEREIIVALTRDGGKPRISASPRGNTRRPNAPVMPETYTIPS